MSSTTRGTLRAKDDYYRTPVQPIVNFLEAAREDLGSEFDPESILDPCAGGDDTHKPPYPAAFQMVFPDVPITTMDIRANSNAEHIKDFLKTEFEPEAFNFVCSNPPFGLALPFIQKSLQVSCRWVGMLLRVNFFGSGCRYEFWKENMPIFTYVHHKRISFTEDGKTDSIEYMHCLWEVGNYPTHTKLRVI